MMLGNVFTLLLLQITPLLGLKNNWFSFDKGTESYHSKESEIEGMIQCSADVINSYNTVPKPIGSDYGDLEWCRAIMKRANLIM